MGKIIDRSGMRFGRLVVVSLCAERAPNRNARWRCHCDCGSETDVDSDKLVTGATKSCGCLGREAIGARNVTHGHSRVGKHSRAYSCWSGMKQRCLEPTYKTYHLYGGRGISICERWLASFENFLADMGEPPLGRSLDRIDVNGPYGPDNCRWATQTEQVRNRTNTRRAVYRGRSMTLGEIADLSGVPYQLLHERLKNGWPIERATNPLKLINGSQTVAQTQRRSNTDR